jgi:hypothetical protein
VEQIRSLNQSIGRLEKVIKEAGQKLPGFTNLTSIKEIGALGASCDSPQFHPIVKSMT